MTFLQAIKFWKNVPQGKLFQRHSQLPLGLHVLLIKVNRMTSNSQAADFPDRCSFLSKSLKTGHFLRGSVCLCPAQHRYSDLDTLHQYPAEVSLFSKRNLSGL